jgi:hypothetical protein
MTIQHSPEPWKAESFNGPVPDFLMSSAVSSDGEFVVAVGSPDRATTIANLNRIIACVNACAGIPIDELHMIKIWRSAHRQSLYREGT